MDLEGPYPEKDRNHRRKTPPPAGNPPDRRIILIELPPSGKG
jgi:hypothetical protein